MIVERNEDKLKVKRVKLVMIYPERTQKERLTVKLRVWKAAFEVEDEDKKQWWKQEKDLKQDLKCTWDSKRQDMRWNMKPNVERKNMKNKNEIKT